MNFNDWSYSIPQRLIGPFYTCLCEAHKSPGIGKGKFRHGAYVPRKVSGFNSYKTHPYLSKYCFPFQHAECSCVLKYGLDNFTKDDVMYVLRIGKDATIRCSKPCPMCVDVLLSTNISTVYYSEEDTYGILNLDEMRN